MRFVLVSNLTDCSARVFVCACVCVRYERKQMGVFFLNCTAQLFFHLAICTHVLAFSFIYTLNTENCPCVFCFEYIHTTIAIKRKSGYSTFLPPYNSAQIFFYSSWNYFLTEIIRQHRTESRFCPLCLLALQLCVSKCNCCKLL